jgi:hypothetical protein
VSCTLKCWRGDFPLSRNQVAPFPETRSHGKGISVHYCTGPRPAFGPRGSETGAPLSHRMDVIVQMAGFRPRVRPHRAWGRLILWCVGRCCALFAGLGTDRRCGARNPICVHVVRATLCARSGRAPGGCKAISGFAPRRTSWLSSPSLSRSSWHYSTLTDTTARCAPSSVLTAPTSASRPTGTDRPPSWTTPPSSTDSFMVPTCSRTPSAIMSVPRPTSLPPVHRRAQCQPALTPFHTVRSRAALRAFGTA